MKPKTCPVSQQFAESKELIYLTKCLVILKATCRKDLNEHLFKDPTYQYNLISDLYAQGRVLNVVPWPFDIFRKLLAEAVLARANSFYYPKPTVYWNKHWIMRHHEPSAYRRLEHHKPKVKDDKQLIRDGWREQKGFDRDYRKAKYNNGRKTYAKNLQNREDRRRTKQLLAHEEYDQLFSIQNPRDWWYWD